MKYLLLTTVAVTSLLPTNGFAGPIHNAAFSGNAEVVKHYIDAGTDVNVMNKHGWTPLHEAVTGGHKEIADLLIAKGADVNAKEAKNRITPLHWAVWRGRKEIVELLIAKGANLNVKNKDGGTPLHNAAWIGHNEIAKLLIVKDADVNAKDVEGQTPLDWAEEEKHKEIANLLRKHSGKTKKELEAGLISPAKQRRPGIFTGSVTVRLIGLGGCACWRVAWSSGAFATSISFPKVGTRTETARAIMRSRPKRPISRLPGCSPT